MRLGMMKVNYSSIINGTQQHYPAYNAKNSRLKAAANANMRIKRSLINAKNCANICNEKAVDGYMTFTNCSFIRKGG